MKNCYFIFMLLTVLASCSRKTIAPPAPAPEAWKPVPEQMPLSEINIPVRINLQPVYQLAEKYVDKEFTSAGWPNDWVYEGCNTRYMYKFRREPLRISFSGRKAEMDFTCFYQVKGAQRACVGGVGVTPWSPPCTCGMNGEPERRIQLGFGAEFYVKNDYTVGAHISVKEPKTFDHCEVCFFRTDITSVIVKNIKPQLDSAKAIAVQQMGAISLKPQVQQLWNRLQEPVSLGGYGYLFINPEQILLNRLNATQQHLDVAIGLTARPHAGFESAQPTSSTLPPLKGGVDTGGFKVYADLHLAYDSLSQVLNRYLAGTRIETEKGPLKKKYIDVDAASVLASGGNRLTLKVKVSGSVNGTVYLTGKPVTDAQGWLTVQELDYDIATRNLLLGTAEWMLNKKITRKLNEMARFELNAYLQRFQQTMSQALNRDWGKGIRSTGRVNQFAVAEILPQPGYLFIRLLATGNMRLNLDELSF